jgi:hypothetical protein
MSKFAAAGDKVTTAAAYLWLLWQQMIIWLKKNFPAFNYDI